MRPRIDDDSRRPGCCCCACSTTSPRPTRDRAERSPRSSSACSYGSGAPDAWGRAPTCSAAPATASFASRREPARCMRIGIFGGRFGVAPMYPRRQTQPQLRPSKPARVPSEFFASPAQGARRSRTTPARSAGQPVGLGVATLHLSQPIASTLATSGLVFSRKGTLVALLPSSCAPLHGL